MCSQLGILQRKKNQKVSDDFWHRNCFWKSNFGTFWHLPIKPIFKIQYFPLGMSFLSLPWKLKNRYCHSLEKEMILKPNYFYDDEEHCLFKYIICFYQLHNYTFHRHHHSNQVLMVFAPDSHARGPGLIPDAGSTLF